MIILFLVLLFLTCISAMLEGETNNKNEEETNENKKI